jgi:hypothetical protein
VKYGCAITLAMLLATTAPAAAQSSAQTPIPILSPAASEPTPASVATPAPTPNFNKIPGTLSLEVTGTPADDAAFLAAQIRDALDRAIRPTLGPGAAISYGPIVPWPLPSLLSGAQVTVNVTVTISGQEVDPPLTAVTTVTLANVSVATESPGVLYLSDDPEYVRSEGLLFRNDVTAARPARLYYYHSVIGIPRDLDVVMTASVPTRVQFIASGSGPDLDVLGVGHSVTRDLLSSLQSNEGTIVDLVPGVPFILRHALMLQGEVVAGAIDVHVLSGGSATLSVVATQAGGNINAYLAGPRLWQDGHRRHGTFDLTGFGAIAATYTVGGAPAAVEYGGRTPTPPNLDPADDGHDYGDYGVVHRIVFTLVNPTDDVHTVYLYEKPLAGPVRSTFIVDGHVKELGCVRLKQPYYVTTYALPPHSNSATTTVTMTDGGAFYPIEYGVTDVAPFPFTPPVGSTDGCSPNAPPMLESPPPVLPSSSPSPGAP